MDLVQVVADELGIDRARVERGLSVLFMSMRMAVDPSTFAKVTAALPGADTWMRGIELTSRRTGEIVALGSPEALERQLKIVGYNETEIRQLGQAVGKVLRELLPQDASDGIAAHVPLLKEPNQR
jgi:uncharacterized protein (DUF2267 family)